MEPDFIQAANYTKANRTAIDCIVAHTMENSEKPGTARAVAHWFGGAAAPKASAHACVDNLEVVCCVHEKDVAWAAPGMNGRGYHIEHAGRAAQDDAGWQDEYSQDMLKLSAKHAAAIAKKYDIPVVKLSPEDLVAGHRGFCGHVDVTLAFKKSTHTDPGKHFPWDEYLAMVAVFMGDEGDDGNGPPTDPSPTIEGAPA